MSSFSLLNQKYFFSQCFLHFCLYFPTINRHSLKTINDFRLDVSMKLDFFSPESSWIFLITRLLFFFFLCFSPQSQDIKFGRRYNAIRWICRVKILAQKNENFWNHSKRFVSKSTIFRCEREKTTNYLLLLGMLAQCKSCTPSMSILKYVFI